MILSIVIALKYTINFTSDTIKFEEYYRIIGDSMGINKE